MPGAKFPVGYDRIYHDIAAKLIDERPQVLEVDMHKQAGYARSTFNYFRQSWLRYYQFLTKAGDHSRAMVALDTYNRLAEYEVRIAPPWTLIFSSKAALPPVTMRSSGKVEETLKDWLPVTEDAREAKATKKGKVRGRIQLRSTHGLPVYDPKAQEESVLKALKIDTKATTNPEQVIPNNPPPNSSIQPSARDQYSFFLANGREPSSQDELETWLKTGQA